MASTTDDQNAHRKLAQLHSRLSFGNPRQPILKQILSELEDPNHQVVLNEMSRNDCMNGFTVLHIANHHNNLETFKNLLEIGADPTIPNQKGLTVVHQAFEKSYTRYVTGGSVQSCPADPFIRAALNNQIDTKNVANPRAPNGLTHFHIACATNNSKAIDFFVRNNCSVNLAIPFDSELFPGYTPLHFAAKFRGDDSVITPIVAANVNYVNRIYARGMTPPRVVLERLHELFSGCTPSHFEATLRDGDESVITSLIAANADVNRKDAKGMTPLHVLIERQLELVALMNNHHQLDKQMRDNEESMRKFLDQYIEEQTGLTKLHVACVLKDLSLAEDLLQQNKVNVNQPIDFNSSIWPGYTALHFAAHFHVDAVRLLVRSGGDLMMKDVNGVTPFDLCLERYSMTDVISIVHNAASQSDVVSSEIFKRLCDSFESMDIRSDDLKIDGNKCFPMDSPLWPGYTFLHFVVQFYSRPPSVYHRGEESKTTVSELRKCFEGGCDLRAQDAHGCTAIHLAFRQNKHDIVGLLLHAYNTLVKCNEEYRSNIYLVDNEDLSLLHIACAVSDTRLPGAEIASLSEVNLTYKGKSLNLVKTGWTPLHVAVSNKDFYITKLLLTRGADFNITDANAMTPIHLSLRHRAPKNLCDILFKLGNVKDMVIDNASYEKLIKACHTGDTSTVKRLLNLAIWLKEGCPDFLKVLRQYGNDADAFINDANAVTPISWAFTYGSKDIGDIFFEIGKLKDVIVDGIGLSHLHVACYTDNVAAAKKLIRLGADVNAAITCDKKMDEKLTDYSGYTPLHFAIERNNKDVVNLLLDSGADFLVKSSPSVSAPLYKALQIYPRRNDCVDVLLSMLDANIELQRKLNEDSGMTMLHLACYLVDVQKISSLVNKLDINAQIHEDSPVWSRFTPLHVLMSVGVDSPQFEDVMKMMVNCGADVTLTDGDGNTPIHMLHTFWQDAADFERVRLLLRSQKDYSINPMNDQGISHFHLACKVYDYVSVERFLKQGVDVNLPIDFYDYNLAFRTPLHIALWSSTDGTNTEMQLQTIDVLLKHGADVHVQDENGLAPIHIATRGRPSRKSFIEKLIEAGADINVRALNDDSPFAMLIESRELVTKEEFALFVEHECFFNGTNNVTKETLLAKIVSRFTTPENRRMIMEELTSNSNLLCVDEIGQSPIHNIVVDTSPILKDVDYARYINKFVQMGYDIDATNDRRRTSLHDASIHRNTAAVSGLLMAGADVNVVEAFGWTAYDFAFFDCLYCLNNLVVGHEDTHLRLKQIFTRHVIKMQLCGLDTRKNSDWLKNKMMAEFGEEPEFVRQVLEELEETKMVKIGTGTLTLRDFLSETGAVASRPSMTSELERSAVDDFFSSLDIACFPLLGGLLKLQYRKMLERLQIMRKSSDSLREIIATRCGVYMPEFCCRKVIRFLSNKEVKYLILAGSKGTYEDIDFDMVNLSRFFIDIDGDL